MSDQEHNRLLALFRHEAPEVVAAFGGLIQALIASKGLDGKPSN